MRRAIDILFASTLSILFAVPILLIAIAVRLGSPGPALFWSDRVGKDNRIFRMPKFRSMRVGAPVLATHLFSDPDTHLTRIGRFLRNSSLDELPQLWSILKGDMSLVGPRPALFNQDDLIALRTRYGIDRLKPGLTGWAQMNGRDELAIDDKIRLEREYLDRRSFLFDAKIVLLTLFKVVKREGIRH